MHATLSPEDVVGKPIWHDIKSVKKDKNMKTKSENKERKIATDLRET